MKRLWRSAPLPAVFGALAALSIPRAADGQAVPREPERACQLSRFEGAVARGAAFERPLAEGLVFLLAPSRHPANPQGWTIEIRSAAHPLHDFVSVATPPYRSFNPRDLTTSYGYSAEAVVQISPRHFWYAPSELDRSRIAQSLSRLLWPAGRSPAELAASKRMLERIHKGRGTLTILDYQLQPPDDEHPLGLIESLRFRVELCTPAADSNIARLAAEMLEGFRRWNPQLEEVEIVEAQEFAETPGEPLGMEPGADRYVILARAVRADRRFAGDLADEAFGVFLASGDPPELGRLIDILPSCRWLDCAMRFDRVQPDSVAVVWQGATYGDRSGRVVYRVAVEDSIDEIDSGARWRFDVPGEPLTGAPPIREDSATSVCLRLPWSEAPTSGLARSAGKDERVSERCEVVDTGKLLAVGATDWTWVLYEHELVFSAAAGAQDVEGAAGARDVEGAAGAQDVEGADFYPDTVPEAELVLFVGQPGDSLVRPVWHDRVETNFEILRPPRAVALSDTTGLLAHRRCLNGTGGCLDHPYRLTWRATVEPLRPRYRERLSVRLPDQWGVWKGVWLDPDRGVAEAAVYLPGDSNCCPSFWAVASVDVRGQSLISDSIVLRPEPDASTWQVLPGERFGPVGEYTSEADLRQRVGASMVPREDLYLAEGFCVDGARVFPDLPFELEVAWADSARSRVAFVRARGAESPWRTSMGVRVGTTLAELEALAGEPITFSGFGWDYGGSASWKEHQGTLGLRLGLDPESDPRLDEIARLDPRAEELFGDRTVRSDHPVARQLTIVVEEIRLDWGRPVEERSCESQDGSRQ